MSYSQWTDFSSFSNLFTKNKERALWAFLTLWTLFGRGEVPIMHKVPKVPIFLFSHVLQENVLHEYPSCKDNILSEMLVVTKELK